MKALLKNYRQSPRKVRLVADLIRGKSVSEARAALAFLPKKSSPAMRKLLDSAVANAASQKASPEDLFVKTVTVNKGTVMRRFKPMARGRAARFARTMSIVALELGMKEGTRDEGRGTKKTPSKKVSTKKKVAKQVSSRT
jgi:large subunit ribosomal protein L22